MRQKVLLGLAVLLALACAPRQVPAQLAGAQAASGGMRLNWTYAQGKTAAVNFKVYRQDNCLSSTGAGQWVAIGSVPVATPTYLDTTIATGKNYCWRVTAVSATGEESTPSSVFSFQVPVPLPDAPTDLRGQLEGM